MTGIGESRQAFGTRAKQALANKIFQKTVVLEIRDTDRYGRSIADIYLGSRWINKELVAEGYAWHYKKYSSDQDLARAEITARGKRVGVWVEANPIPPWEFRRGKKAGASTTSHRDGTALTGAQYWLNTSSNARHNEGCRWFKQTKRGRICGPNEGKGCGMCGG